MFDALILSSMSNPEKEFIIYQAREGGYVFRVIPYSPIIAEGHSIGTGNFDKVAQLAGKAKEHGYTVRLITDEWQGGRLPLNPQDEARFRKDLGLL